MTQQNNNPKKPTVFICYSHKDESYKDLLRSHLGVLEQQSRIAVWDDRAIDGGDQWYDEIKAAMERAKVAVCLVSSDFLRSDFINKEEVPYLIQRRQQEGMIVLPVLVRPCLWEAVDWLSAIQMIPRDGMTISRDFKDDPDTPLTDVATRVLKIIDDPTYQAPAPPPPLWQPLPASSINIDHLPETGTEIFGRAKELALLDDAWKDDSTNIVSFVAWGGVGKSALTKKWLEYMAADNYRGAAKVYAWSFYSQGTGERVTSADLFVNDALQYFGDPDMAASARSPWDKGQRLAELIQQQRTLLILDGLEPLQSDFDHDRGAVKDPAVGMLLSALAKNNPGLCLISTRVALPGPLTESSAVQQKQLDQISDEAGRALLRVNGIKGTDAQLEQLTRDFGNHALAINLLVSYLGDAPGRHATAAAHIPDLDIPEEDGKHPRRVMAAIAERLGPSAELDLLHIMGLFDRPIQVEEINYLRSKTLDCDLLDRIVNSSDNQWQRVLDNLRSKNLIAPPSHHDLDALDTHPLVRKHFGDELRTQDESTWRQAHERLYEYYKSVPEKELPDTIEEMAPLYRAVAHGCAAGKHREALADVYQDRIQRGDQGYNRHKLAAIGSELACLAVFFSYLSRQPDAGFTKQEAGYIFSGYGYDLRALGRLREAVKPTRAAMAIAYDLPNWQNAAISAGNLSELYLVLGDVTDAIKYGRKTVQYADTSGDHNRRIVSATTLADALHQAGQVAQAQDLFEQAEEMQKAFPPKFLFLYSLRGFQYCDLLLSQGRYDDVLERARHTLDWAEEASQDLLSPALDHLSLGRAHLLKADKEGGRNFRHADKHTTAAVDGLRAARHMQYLPLGLLARAEFARVTEDFPSAHRNLDEAFELATRCEMRLHLTDCHLAYARLCIAENDRETAQTHIDKAATLINQTGYHRRDPDLAALRRTLT